MRLLVLHDATWAEAIKTIKNKTVTFQYGHLHMQAEYFNDNN